MTRGALSPLMTLQDLRSNISILVFGDKCRRATGTLDSWSLSNTGGNGLMYRMRFWLNLEFSCKELKKLEVNKVEKVDRTNGVVANATF